MKRLLLALAAFVAAFALTAPAFADQAPGYGYKSRRVVSHYHYYPRHYYTRCATYCQLRGYTRYGRPIVCCRLVPRCSNCGPFGWFAWDPDATPRDNFLANIYPVGVMDGGIY